MVIIMKKVFIITVALILAISMIGGCGKNNGNKGNGENMSETKKEYGTVLYESENFKIDKPMAVFMYNDLYNKYYSMYGEYAQYFMSSDVTTLIGAKTILARCEAAKAAGIELSEDQLLKIENDIKKLEAECKEKGSSISEVYGKSVTKADIREVMKLKALAASISDKKEAEFTDMILADEERMDKLFTNGAVKDMTLTKNAGHILIKVEGQSSEELEAALTEAKKILNEYLGGERTKAAFEAIAEKYTDDSSVFYYNITMGMMVESFEAWIFDESRQIGETAIVQTEYGYHIMYFDGNGLETWKANALEGLLNEEMSKWSSEIYIKYEIKINTSEIDNIFGVRQ